MTEFLDQSSFKEVLANPHYTHEYMVVLFTQMATTMVKNRNPIVTLPGPETSTVPQKMYFDEPKQELAISLITELSRMVHSRILANSLFIRSHHISRKGLEDSLTFCNVSRFHQIMESIRETPVLLVGVDGGGNKCRVCIETAKGVLLGGACVKKPSHISFGDKTWENIIEGMENILSAFEIPLQSQCLTYCGCFGLAGCSVPEYVAKFKQNPCWRLFTQLSITKDSEIAQVASHNGKDGGIIIIGTGSAAFAKVGDDAYVSGGRGFPLSDGGSGAYVGLKTAKALVRAFDSEEPWGPLTTDVATVFENKVTKLIEWAKKANPSEFSTLAPYVAKHAKHDPVAQKIVKSAAKEIAKLYDNVLRKINKPEATSCMKFSLLGGLSDTIKPHLPPRMMKAVVQPIYSPAKGAVLIVRKDFWKSD